MTDNDAYNGPAFEKIILNQIHVAVGQVLSEEDLASIRMGDSRLVHHFANNLVHHLVTFGLPADDLGYEVVYYPASWWDHAKRDLLPAWVTRRLKPPRYESTRVDVRALYHSGIRIPEFPHRVEILRQVRNPHGGDTE